MHDFFVYTAMRGFTLRVATPTRKHSRMQWRDIAHSAHMLHQRTGLLHAVLQPRGGCLQLCASVWPRWQSFGAAGTCRTPVCGCQSFGVSPRCHSELGRRRCSECNPALTNATLPQHARVFVAQMLRLDERRVRRGQVAWQTGLSEAEVDGMPRQYRAAASSGQLPWTPCVPASVTVMLQCGCCRCAHQTGPGKGRCKGRCAASLVGHRLHVQVGFLPPACLGPGHATPRPNCEPLVQAAWRPWRRRGTRCRQSRGRWRLLQGGPPARGAATLCPRPTPATACEQASEGLSSDHSTEQEAECRWSAARAPQVDVAAGSTSLV